MKRYFRLATGLFLCVAALSYGQNSGDEGGRILGLETAWNRAIEKFT